MTHSSRTGRRAAVIVAVAALLGPAACTEASSGGGTATTVAPAPAPTTSTPTSPTSSSPPKRRVPKRNPFTDIGPVPKSPVIAVKVDDTAPGRPQLNIDKADIVYVEAVEGGLDRLVALFSSYQPTHVGYVRSTRPSDPDLLLQYGRITEAFSGGQQVSRDLLAKSGIKGWNLGAGRPYFHRETRSESDYINVVLDLKRVAAAVHTNRPRKNGWTFDRSLAGIGTRPGRQVDTVVTGSYSEGTPVQFRWSPRLRRYVRYIDGTMQRAADGKPVTAVNVVVQSCNVYSYTADVDVNGNPAQFTRTVGKGALAVFRNGRRINGTWSRGTLRSGTRLHTGGGKTLPLNPGRTWVVLIRKGVAVRS